jgi:hypothetical protein
MINKREHQENVIQQRVTLFNYENSAKEIVKSKDFVKYCINQKGEFIKAKVKNLVYKKFPDITNEERKMIYVEIVETPDKYRGIIMENIEEKTGEQTLPDSNKEVLNGSKK